MNRYFIIHHNKKLDLRFVSETFYNIDEAKEYMKQKQKRYPDDTYWLTVEVSE